MTLEQMHRLARLEADFLRDALENLALLAEMPLSDTPATLRLEQIAKRARIEAHLSPIRAARLAEATTNDTDE